ncbi:MAG: glycosyltransferase family 39 protein [Candidatus Choladocola sp.]|nr:glycosyltransferase family 39 protein [Candidatus Choladocola sp.]
MELCEKNKNNPAKFVAAASFVFFVFLMSYNLMHSALWTDEWVEYRISQLSTRDGSMYQQIIKTFQPPLYNFVMHFWLRISNSIEWFRFFNVIIGTIAGIFLYLSLKKMYTAYVASAALVMLSISYQWIYCIQECSEYTLMLMFLFGSIYYYIQAVDTKSTRSAILFVLMCVGAMYSQYGSFFVVVPLLVLFYANVLGEKKRKRIVAVTVGYALCLIVFAAPLYWFFARIQMANNEIGSADTIVSFTADNIKELPLVIGQLVGYLWNLNLDQITGYLINIFSILLLTAAFWLLFKMRKQWIKVSLILVLLVAYIFHYILVVLHIYAMVHPGQSAGFYSRYSYFYIPLFCIVIPVIFMECLKRIRSQEIKYAVLGGTFMVSVLIAVFAFPNIVENWNKSYDDQIAEIWLNNKGYNDTTYLLDNAKSGFNYYIVQGENADYQQNVLAASKMDYENLPQKFWLWRSSGGDERYLKVIEAVKEKGYSVQEYLNKGYGGRLTCCIKVE